MLFQLNQIKWYTINFLCILRWNWSTENFTHFSFKTWKDFCCMVLMARLYGFVWSTLSYALKCVWTAQMTRACDVVMHYVLFGSKVRVLYTGVYCCVSHFWVLQIICDSHRKWSCIHTADATCFSLSLSTWLLSSLPLALLFLPFPLVVFFCASRIAHLLCMRMCVCQCLDVFLVNGRGPASIWDLFFL